MVVESLSSVSAKTSLGDETKMKIENPYMKPSQKMSEQGVYGYDDQIVCLCLRSAGCTDDEILLKLKARKRNLTIYDVNNLRYLRPSFVAELLDMTLSQLGSFLHFIDIFKRKSAPFYYGVLMPPFDCVEPVDTPKIMKDALHGLRDEMNDMRTQPDNIQNWSIDQLQKFANCPSVVIACELDDTERCAEERQLVCHSLTDKKKLSAKATAVFDKKMTANAVVATEGMSLCLRRHLSGN